MSDLDRVTLACRVFTLAGLWASVVFAGSANYSALLLVTVTALLATTITSSARTQSLSVAVAEAGIVGILAIWVDPAASAAVPYLAVPTLVGGLSGRLTGVAYTLCAEAAALVIAGVASPAPLSDTALSSLVLWMVTATGTGLLGASIHRLFAESRTTAAYRDAIDLIEQLHSLSGQLSEGLDVSETADRVLTRATDLVPSTSAALLTRTPAGEYTPILFTAGSQPDQLADIVGRLDQVWRSRKQWRADERYALPLLRDNNVVCVLIGHAAVPLADSMLADAADTLTGEVLRLDAALMFSDIAASATHEERQRLAREVHDGLAQDLASLGYLIDALDPSDPAIEERIGDVRGQVTRVLREVRQSVTGLRTDLRGELTVGQSLAMMAARVEAENPFAVHVDIKEAGTRLPQNAEAQLIRIAQEAINNARKHASPANLWVTCHVDPPEALISVRDDGVGLGPGRADSYGLSIMRERATQIGASLTVSPVPDGSGTLVRVQLGDLDDR